MRIHDEMVYHSDPKPDERVFYLKFENGKAVKIPLTGVRKIKKEHKKPITGNVGFFEVNLEMPSGEYYYARNHVSGAELMYNLTEALIGISSKEKDPAERIAMTKDYIQWMKGQSTGCLAPDEARDLHDVLSRLNRACGDR